MEYERPMQRVRRSADHIGDVFEEINWAFADAFDVALKGMARFIKKRRAKK